MVITRAEAALAFTHVLDNVLVHPVHLKSALVRDGINNIFDLLTIQDTDIDDLQYENTDSEYEKATLHPVLKHDKQLLRAFHDYVVYCHNQGTPIGDKWTSITASDFGTFCTSVAHLSTFTSTPMITLESPLPVTSSPSYSPDESDYPTLMDEKTNDLLHHSFVIQAESHDSNDVLNLKNQESMIKENIDLILVEQKLNCYDCESELEVLDHPSMIDKDAAEIMTDINAESLLYPADTANSHDDKDINPQVKVHSEDSYDALVLGLLVDGEFVKDFGILMANGTKMNDICCEILDTAYNKRILKVHYKRGISDRGDAQSNDCQYQFSTIKHHVCVTIKFNNCSCFEAIVPSLMWRIVQVIKLFKMRKKKYAFQPSVHIHRFGNK